MTLRTGLAAGALCAITLLAYANSFDTGFVRDSRFFVLLDTRVHEATLANLALIVDHTYWWPAIESGLYRPVANLSYLFNYAVLGNAEQPAGYHWINLLLHAGNVLLVFALARRLLKNTLPSFLIGAVWAVHPVLTESVTYIVGRADLLAGMTTLGGLLIYLKSLEATGRRRMLLLASLTAVTTVGVFSKESAVAVVGIIALYEFTWWGPNRLQGFLDGCCAMSPALLAMWWMRSRAHTGSLPPQFADNPIVGADFWTARLTAIKVLAKYLGLLVWPAHLSADYSYPQIPLATGMLTDWIAWIVMAAVVVAVALLYRRNKTEFFAAGFAFITLLPASNLVIPVGTIMAERFLYLPAIGFSICLVLALESLGRRVRVAALAPVLCLLIAAGFGARTWARNSDWRDEFTLWSADVRTSPLSFRTHAALADAMHSRHLDPYRVLSEDEQGIAPLKALPDRLNFEAPWLQSAGHYIEQGDTLRRQSSGLITPAEIASNYDRGRSLAFRSVSIALAQRKTAKPDDEVRAYLMLSLADQRLGKMEESLNAAREARTRGLGNAEVYLRIHEVLRATGRREEAIAALLEGVFLTSGPRLLLRLADDYAESPDESKCAISYADGLPKIDFSCPVVRRQVCAVSAEVIGLGLKAGGPEVAERLKDGLVTKYGCPETPPR